MNSHEYDVEALDELFRQALQPERQARASHYVWQRVLKDLGFVSPRLWQSLMAFFQALDTIDVSSKMRRRTSAGPMEFFEASPFVGAMFNQMLDLRMPL
jgi:thioredoxin-like negative regulator of GroEL